MSVPASHQIRNFIGGQWLAPTSEPGLELINPATGESLGRSPAGSEAEVDAAVQAAQAAFPAWRAMPAGDRVQYLFKLKSLLEEHFDELGGADHHRRMARRWARPRASCGAALRMSRSRAAFRC